MYQPVETSITASGYLSLCYAEAFSEVGNPIRLPNAEGWIISRPLVQENLNDGMGCYPLFCCEHWHGLHGDLAHLDGQLVSLAVVTDPFGDYNMNDLRNCFPDALAPFKQHFVVDLHQEKSSYIHAGHIRNAKKALKSLRLEKCEQPGEYVNDWLRLYGILTSRHDIRGVSAFSEASFRQQFQTPGLHLFRAEYLGEVVGMVMWYIHGSIGYYHLAAYDEIGYRHSASFGLFWLAIDYFASLDLRWLNLGGSAGLIDTCDGLSRFKSGWSTGTKTAYFCGRIMNRPAYDRLTKITGDGGQHYFPAYRYGASE